MATLLHGTINLSQGVLLGGIDPAREYWLLAAVYGVAALVLVAIAGPDLLWRSQMLRDAPVGAGPRSKETPGRP
jgi:hypothetical protein